MMPGPGDGGGSAGGGNLSLETRYVIYEMELYCTEDAKER